MLWRLLAPRLVRLIPEGYLLHPGGRIVRTNPDRPDILELPIERGRKVRMPAPLASEVGWTDCNLMKQSGLRGNGKANKGKRVISVNYDAVIEPTTPDGWCGWVAGLPVFGEGATPQDCLNDLESAAAVCVERMLELGEAIPAPTLFTDKLPPGGRVLRGAIKSNTRKREPPLNPKNAR